MSLIPAFEIGVWNAWVFMLCHILLYLLVMLVPTCRYRSREMETTHTETEKRLYPTIMILWVLAIIYSIFLPLSLKTIWFYAGLPIFVLGLIGQTAVCLSICTIPINEKPLTSGIYRYSRHPYYVTQLIMFIGAGLASASWIFIVFSVVSFILYSVMAIPEEHRCLEKYGDVYREYMNMTPRWIGIPKSQ